MGQGSEQQTLERPRRGAIDPAASTLAERHGSVLMLTARRYAATREDAEDALQRAFEILLRRAPAVAEAELLAWLKTVVKHEAFALRRAREREAPLTRDGQLAERTAAAERTALAESALDEAERRAETEQGAEALARLKPQETRALLLRASGYSYKEICALTGWSYTKLNRTLTEGRRSFRTRVAGIEAGIECARLEPLLSRLADREASAEDLAVLRPHLKRCLSCRARLRAFRSTPRRVAALTPLAVAAAARGDGSGGGTLRGLFESVSAAFQHKAAAFSERAHAATELVTGKKMVVVAASAAALAGGGTAAEQIAAHPDPPLVPSVSEAAPATTPAEPDPEPMAAMPDPPIVPSEPSAPSTNATRSAASTPSTPPPAPEPAPDPANEFDPAAAAGTATPSSSSGNAGSTPAPTAQRAPTASPPTDTFSPSSSPSGPSPPGSSEFSP